MKILGISGSPRPAAQSGVFTLVETVLENSGCEYELVSLAGKQISGCRACLGCVEDNICKVVDDMSDLRELVVAADAYVIGAPNYYSTLNVATHAFLERWFQFRHQEGNLLWGKLAVAVGVGGTGGQAPAQEIEKFYIILRREFREKVYFPPLRFCLFDYFRQVTIRLSVRNAYQSPHFPHCGLRPHPDNVINFQIIAKENFFPAVIGCN